MPEAIKKLIQTLLILVPVLPAMAQETVDETEEPEIRRYTVEIIVFRYGDDVSSGSEVFLGEEIDEAAFEEELEFLDSRPLRTEDDFVLPPDIELMLLEEDDYQLDEAMGHLRRIDAYEPLMHFGWTQATWPEEETEFIPLTRFAEPPPGLNGNLKLYLSRFLHLVVDLQLDAVDPASLTDDEVELIGDTRYSDTPLGYAGEKTLRGPVRYVIDENRILKNGELRYYDHPKFGVLAKVTRVEETEDEEDPADFELLGYGPE